MDRYSTGEAPACSGASRMVKITREREDGAINDPEARPLCFEYTKLRHGKDGQKMTGKEWTQLRTEMFQVGAVIECIENTYIPTRNGTTRTIERAGTTVADCRTPDGKPYRMEMPRRVSEIELLDPGTVRYPLGRDDHTVTIRRVA